MQKYLLVLLSFLPTLSFATTSHFASAGLTSQDSIRGHAISYSAIFNERYTFNLGYQDASKDQISISSTSVGFSYGFESFKTGSTYFGLGVADINNSTLRISTPMGFVDLDSSGVSAFAEIGYTKLSGQGLDYDLSLMTMEGDTTASASLRIATEGSPLGWQLGVSNTDGETALFAGASVIF